MDKQTEEICKQGAKALADIYTIILEDMGIHVENDKEEEPNLSVEDIEENIDSDKFITHTQKLFLLAMLTNDENMANNQKLLETMDKYDTLSYEEFEEKICSNMWESD